MGVRFFFEQTNEHLKNNFANVFERKMNSYYTEQSSAIMKPYGWLNVLYSIAREGIFTKHPYNAIDSVLKENLYKVFTYYSFVSSEIEYKEEAEKEIERKMK